MSFVVVHDLFCVLASLSFHALFGHGFNPEIDHVWNCSFELGLVLKFDEFGALFQARDLARALRKDLSRSQS
ncbi:MAG: DUF2333 family protein, partial [Rhodospirillales bacterium]